MSAPPSTVDPQTIAFYARIAEHYADDTAKVEPDADLRAFLAELPAGAKVLDWGCGPGATATLLAMLGHEVTATDACPEMARIAGTLGTRVLVEPFEALDAEAAYDGIWANFALMHAPRAAMADLLARAARALRPGGVLHLGVAPPLEGRPLEGRDENGVWMARWDPDEIDALAAPAGLVPIARRWGEARGPMDETNRFAVLRHRRDPEA